MNALRTVGGVMFALAAAVATGGYWYRPELYPPYMDFDSATLGIFVNNLTYHGQVDYFFEESVLDQDRYRMFWGAQFLPVAAVLSLIQRALQIPPDAVGELLGAATMLLGLAGCCLAALLMRQSPGIGRMEAAFVVAFCAVFPPYLLYVRTEVVNFLYAFCTFWLVVLLYVRFLDLPNAGRAVALAAAAALHALLPYTPIVWLPMVMAWIAIQRRMVGTLVRTPWPYLAVVLAAVLVVAAQYAVAVGYEGSYPAWRQKVDAFVAQRSSHAFSWQQASPALLPRKAELLLHQHFYFRHDRLGDRTRHDELWTLPQPHIVWLLLVPVMLLGLWRGLRQGDATAHVFASVLAAAYLIALTFGAPEGRYLLAAVPSYAFFLCTGVRAILEDRRLVGPAFAAILVAMTANTWVLVRGPYEAYMEHAWHEMAGMRPVLERLREAHGADSGKDDEVVFLGTPKLSYFSWLYLQMLGNLQVSTFTIDDLRSGFGRGERLFASLDATDEQAIARWSSQGFERIDEAVDPPTGRRFVVLARDRVRRPGRPGGAVGN